MNVCYIITSTIKCGPVNVLYGIVKNYKSISGFKPYIITLKSDNPNKSMKSKFEKLGIKVVQFNLKKDLKKIIDFINENNCKIIHSHGLKPDILNSLLLKKFPNKYMHVTTLHNYPFKDYVMSRGYIKGNLMALLHINVIKNLHKISCSYAIQQQYMKYSHIQTDVIENGVIFPPKSEVIEKKGEKIGKKVLFVGDLRKRKHVEFLVDYFKKHSEFTFWIVGDGVDYEEICTKAKTIKNIKMIGRTENPNYFYQKADIFISDSAAEGLPMSVLEALSYGLPVILSNIPAHIEIIKKSSIFGSLFKLDNEKDLTKELKKIDCRNNKKRYLISKEYFSSEVMMKKYIKYYLKYIKD